MANNITLENQPSEKNKKQRRFVNNKLKDNHWTAFFLYMIVMSLYSVVQALSGDGFSIIGQLQFFSTLTVLIIFIYKIKSRKYFHAVLVLSIMPIVYYVSHTFVPFYTYSFNIYNTFSPLVLIIVFDIYCYFFAQGPHQSVLIFAAKSVNSTEDGYTTRPYPSGAKEYSKNDAINFTYYLSNKYMGVTYLYEDKVVFLFRNSFQYLTFLKPDYDRYSYLELNYDGNINVHVGKRDYELYKDELTYNELCRSFGIIMKGFLNLYIKGDTALINRELRKHVHYY